jgi:cleavage and polyadenylation specificity factor subunit 1
MGLAGTRGKRGGKKGKTGRGEEEEEREEEEEAKAAMAMARGLEEVGEGEGVEGGEALGEDEEEMILYGAGKEGRDGEEGSEGGREAGAASGDVEAVVEEEEGRRGPGAEALGSPNGRREEEEGREVAMEGQGEEVGEEEDEGVVLCGLCRADGSLEILLLPRQLPCPGSAEDSSSLLPALPRLVYASARCAEGPRLLRNALLFPDMKFRPGKREKAAPGLEGEAQMAAAAYPVVSEMSLALVGPAASLEGGGEGGTEGGAEGGRVAAAARLLERVCLVLWTSEDDLLVYVARPVAGTFLTPPRGGEGGAGGGRAMRPLPWSLLRLSHDLITREPRHALQAPDRPPLHRRLFPFPASPPAVPSSSSTSPFTVGVGHQRGVFVGGLTPAWIINERGSPRVLPAGIRDPYTAVSAPSPASSSGKTVLPPSLPPHPHVAAFVPFPDAPAGFLVAHNGSQGLACLSLCVANLGGSLGYTAPSGALSGASVTFRRLGPLGHEAKKVVALEGIGTGVPFYAVVVGRGEGERAEEEAEGEGDGGVGEEEEDEEDEERRKLGASKRVGASAHVDVGMTKTGERLTDFTSAKAEYLGGPPLPAVWAGGHQIFIMGGAPFGVTSVIPLEPFERGLALMVYHRRSPSAPAFPPGPPSHQSHFRERYPNRAPPPADLPPFQAADTYLAVGTCTVRAKGEDVPSKGRLLIYRISLDPYAGLTSPPTLTLVDQYSQRSGPPTAIAQLGPHIIIAAGPTLWVYAFSAREKLKPIAFYDADFYVVSLRVVKTLVAVTDAYHSVHLLRWHEHDPAHTLELMGKDYSPIVSAQPGGSHFVVDPPSLGMLVGDSRGNLQLLQYDPADVESRGGNRLVRRADFHLSHRLSFLQHTRMAEVPRPGAYRAGVRVMVFGSVEGGVGALVPVEEKVYRRLYALQAVMVNALPHVGAFNPRGFRLVEARGWAQGRKKGTLDGELLWRFAGLSVGKQEDLASAIGTSREMVLESLLEVDMMTWTL